MVKKKSIIFSVLILATLILVLTFGLKNNFIRENGGPIPFEMRSKIVTLCEGKEITIFDDRPEDGSKLSFCFGTVKTVTLKQLCPDAWYINEMPSPNGGGGGQYMIINGKNVSPMEIDTWWVMQNCKVSKPSIVS